MIQRREYEETQEKSLSFDGPFIGFTMCRKQHNRNTRQIVKIGDYEPAASNVSRGGKGKGKAVQLQAWTGPEGSRKLRLPDFVTTAQDGGKVVSLTHRPPLPPGNTPGTPGP